MIAGGLSLSLDIDKALDSLPRDQIVPSTQEAGLEPEEIALALHIHLQAKLCFSIAHQETELHFRKAFGKAACHDHPFDVRDTGEPGGYGASGHRGADEINAAIVQGGPATPGPMEGVTDLDQTEEKADRTGRPAKWQRDNSKGSTQPGKGKGAQGRGPAQSKPPPFQVPCAREVAPPDLNRTILPRLFTTAQTWHEMKHNDPDSISQPMRVILWQKLMTELKTRAQKENAMKLLEDREPLSAKRVVEVAQELATLSVQPQLLNRFHATRQLQEQMEGSTVTWLLEVGWRGEQTARFWELLQLLSHNSALLMIGCTLRPDRLQRSALAQQLQLDTQGKGKGKSKSHKGTSKGFSKSGPLSLVAAAPNSSWRGDYTGGFDEQMTGPWPSTRTGLLGMESDQEWLTHRMNTLAQLVLRQEQTLASLRQDLVIYLFVRSGREGMVPILCEAADKWRTLKETEPDKLTYSLKLAMFKRLLISLHQRLSETIKDKEAMERATSLNWVDEKQHWRHLNWSVTVRKDTRPLEGLSGVLHIPMYQGPRTLRTTLLPFQVTAVQHHYGESPVTGHYRSLLCGQNRFAEGRSWLTDDGKPAQIMPLDSYELCTTAYLIWLRQVNTI
eukprot:s1955_g17.t1